MTLFGSCRGVLLFGLALLLSPLSAGAQSTIVVNFGRYPSAQAAALAEAEVSWLDVDTLDDTVCTQCFAAVELQRYLRRLTGRPDDFAIAGDNAIPPLNHLAGLLEPAATPRPADGDQTLVGHCRSCVCADTGCED